MATKKQKREALLAKRAEFEEKMRLSGLQAQEKDRQHREAAQRRNWQEQHDKKHNWKKLIQECPHCRDILKNSKKVG